MKTSLKPAKINRTGDFNETKFGIKNNEDLVYIFDILRNKLYTNKVAAIVREYSTNAYDAHVDSGIKEKPIRITAPTTLNPSISIRDFGEGLSEEDIREVYCMYGRSTKRNSNEFTGQLGLGCKSAFSYSESFTIVSRYNGEEITYNAYIDETRVGSIAKMSSVPTQETGIEIIVPVKTNDITEFNREINNICRFFSVCPELINLKREEEDSPLIDTESWSLLAKPSGNSYAVMGNIGYPINIEALGINGYSYRYDKDTDEKIIHGLLSSYNLNIKVPVGKLNIAANREGLEYDEYTKKNLKEIILNVRNEFVEKVKSMIESEPSAIKRVHLYNKIISGVYYGHRIFGDNFDLILPCGKKLNQGFVSCSDVNCWFIDRKTPGKKKKSEKIVPSKKSAYIYRDIESDSYISKAFHYLDSNDDIDSVYVVDRIDPSNTDLFPFINDFIKSSSLKKPKRVKTSYHNNSGYSIDRSKFNCYTIVDSLSSYSSGESCFNETKAPKDPEEAHYYLEINRYDFTRNNDSNGRAIYCSPLDIKKIVQFLDRFDSSIESNFYCIKTSEIKHINGSENWIRLNHGIDLLFLNNETFSREVKKSISSLSIKNSSLSSYGDLLKRMGPIHNLSDESVFSKTYKYCMEATSSAKTVSINPAMNNIFSNNFSKEISKIEKTYDSKNDAIVNRLLDAYPMIGLCNIYTSMQGDIDKIANYVKLVENCSSSS